MRILVVTNLYPPHGVGGYEERCRTVVEGLRARGHTVQVLTSDYIRGEQVPWERQVARELWLNGLFEAPMRSYAALHAIEEHNHECLQVWLRRTAAEVVYVWNLGGLSKSLLLALARDGVPHRVDVGDAWLARTLATDPWLARWNGPATAATRLWRRWREAIGTRRRLEATLPTGPWVPLEWSAFHFASAHLRTAAAQAGWPVAEAPVLLGGVPLEGVRSREGRPLGRRLLWTGRILPDRGPKTALEALAHLWRKGEHGWTLDFLGRAERSFQEELEAQARKLGVLAAVSFRTTSAERRRELLAEYDLLWATGGGSTASGLLAVWEARAAGLPTLLASREGLSELVEPGVNGWIFPDGDAVALAALTEQLVAAPTETLRIAAVGQAETCREHSLEAYIDAVEARLRRD